MMAEEFSAQEGPHSLAEKSQFSDAVRRPNPRSTCSLTQVNLDDQANLVEKAVIASHPHSVLQLPFEEAPRALCA